jgi:hypothetical protein
LQAPTDFGPAATQSVTLPPGAAKGASPTGSPTHTLNAKTLKRLARDEAPSADASELAGLEFEQETTALEGGASLPDTDQGVLSAPPPPASNAEG